MCGIIGFIGKTKCLTYLLNGLKMLQNRGYDSAGISILNETFEIYKKASTKDYDSIQNLEDNLNKIKDGFNGIAHTRWATHGKKNDTNSHPHFSMSGNVSVVHNGIIENYLEIKNFLIKEGFVFQSDTDTEVIAQLIEYYMNTTSDIFKVFDETTSTLKGTWAVLVQLKKYPHHLIALKNGSPLLLGKNQDGYTFTSEVSGFQNTIDNYIVIEDKSVLLVDSIRNKVLTKKGGLDLSKIKTFKVNKELIDLTPDPFPHWMLKEIYDQVESSKRAINFGARLRGDLGIKLGGLEKHQDELFKYNKICLLACGTSYHAAMFGNVIFTKFGVFESVKTMDASEFYDYNFEHKTLYIVLSQSGETKDVHRAMEIIKRKGGQIVSIVNVVESLIAREALCGTYLNAGSEKAVASTKSFTNQIIVLTLIAMWWYKNSFCSKNREELFEDLHQDLLDLPEKIKETIDSSFTLIKELSSELKNQHSLFLLGRGLLYPIALEGALKIKEISYLHAEGYCGGALKHGPFALINEGTPIFILSNNDTNADRMESAAEEVSCRGANTILIGNDEKLNKSNIYNSFIKVPKLKVLSSLLSIIPLQLLSYQIGIDKGNSVDKPQNLAKCVVVDG